MGGLRARTQIPEPSAMPFHPPLQRAACTQPLLRTSRPVMLWFTEASGLSPHSAPPSMTPSGSEVREGLGEGDCSCRRRCRGRAVAGSRQTMVVMCMYAKGGDCVGPGVSGQVQILFHTLSCHSLLQNHTLSMPWSMETMSTSSSERSLWRMSDWGG